MGKAFEQMFLQRKYTNGQYLQTKMLNSVSHQRNANQNTIGYHFTPTRMAIIQNWKIPSVNQDLEKLEDS